MAQSFRARSWRGAGVAARREGESVDHRARLDRAASLPDWSRSSAERDAVRRNAAALAARYEHPIHRESAYEKLKARTLDKPAAGGELSAPPAGGLTDMLAGVLLGSTGPRGGHREGLLEAAAKSAARSVGSNVGRAILRGALGSIPGSGTRPRR